MRSEGKYNSDFTVLDIYRFYRDSVKNVNKIPIDQSTFRKILRYYNTKVCEEIVENSEELRMPYRLGYLRIKKFKFRLILDADGNIKKSHLKPDWKKTKELWENNEDAKLNKKLVYHTNKHTQGYYFKFYWDKRTCNIKNSSVYSLAMTRTNKRLIAKTIKTKENIDYYE